MNKRTDLCVNQAEFKNELMIQNCRWDQMFFFKKFYLSPSICYNMLDLIVIYIYIWERLCWELFKKPIDGKQFWTVRFIFLMGPAS